MTGQGVVPDYRQDLLLLCSSTQTCRRHTWCLILPPLATPPGGNSPGLASLPPSSAHQRLGWPEYRYLQNIHFCPSPLGEGSEADGSKVPTLSHGRLTTPSDQRPPGQAFRLSRLWLQVSAQRWSGATGRQHEALSLVWAPLPAEVPGSQEAASSRKGMNLINVSSFNPALIKTPKQNRKQGDLEPINILKLYR